MKILHINSYYSGSNFYKNLYDKQKEGGLDFDVYVPVSKAVDTSALKLGDYTTISTNHGKYDRLLFHIKHNKIYKDIIKKYRIKNYSVIHAHSLFSNGYIAMKLKQHYGIPYIVTVRNTDVNTFFKRMIHLRRMGIKILEDADRVIFLSKSYRDEVIKKYVPDNLKSEILYKTSVIPNGIDEFWIKNKGEVKIINNECDINLLYVGVVNKNKNIERTVKAIEILLKKGLNPKLTVIGKVKDQSVYTHIKTLQYVNYIEPKPREELLGIYRQNDIFVMPSIHESFGLVYAEAMSQGLPVIYSRGQGFDGQFIEGEVGFNVDSFNVDDIANRIEEILIKYKSISQNCIQQSERFKWSKIANQYNEIYERITNII